MDTLVLPLGSLPTGDGPAFVLVARHAEGTVTLGTGASWAAAASELAPKLSGRVRCGPALATHARRHGWSQSQPTELEYLQAATFAVVLQAQLPPQHEALVARYVAAWVGFFRLRLWEQLPAQMSFPFLFKRSGHCQDTCLAVMGQSGLEFGFAYYEDPAAFDAMWNGQHFELDGLSVLVSDDPHLEPAFAPLDVPPPVLTWLQRTRPKAPRLADYGKAAAAMELMRGLLQGEARPLPAGDGATLEFKRTIPPELAKRVAKKAQTGPRARRRKT